jgi:DNA polymerase I-like protein with 3'-5' exonuclease and polymerase domains
MKAEGRADSPYLFVMVSQPSPGMLAWFWRQVHAAGIKKTECRLVFLIDEPPAGAGNKPLKSQIRSARDRFERDIKRSTPQVVVPMGTEPFGLLTGINEGIFDARGYLIQKDLFRPRATEVWKQVGSYVNASKATGAKAGDPKMKWVKELQPGLLGDFEGYVIPTFTLDHIRTESYAVAPAFIADLQRIHRAGTGDLREVRLSNYHKVLETCPDPDSLGDLVAVDIETHGIDNEVIDLVSFSDGETTAALDWHEGTRVYIERLMNKPGRVIAFHNSPFDVPRLRVNGVSIPDSIQMFDTMFAFVNVQPDLHKALGRACSVLLDLRPWKTSSRNKVDTHWRAMVKSDPRGYAAKDSFNTYWLATQLIAIMKDLGAWKYFMGVDGHPGPGVMATLPVLSEMSSGGIRVSRERALHLQPLLEKRAFRYAKLWRSMFPLVNPSSNPKVMKLFYKQWGLPVYRNKEDGVSVDELALVKLAAYVKENREDDTIPGAWQTDPRAVPRTFELLMKIRKVTKMLGTYVTPVMLGEDQWVHPSYLPASKDDERGGKKMDNKGATATGRLASFKPNIQNQMKDEICGTTVRHLYVPDTDQMCFVQADYSAAELYSLAGMSGDRKLFADLNTTEAGGLHQRNADRIGVSRKVAKNVTYASQYLASPSKQSSMILEQEHFYVSSAQCLEVSNAIWGYYTDATAYKEMLVELCNTQRYIQNPFGRTRFFHSGKATAAVNFIPQSIVADILWCVLKDVADLARSLDGRLVTTVHDSILLCVPEENVMAAAKGMKKIMERKFHCIRKNFYIPVSVEAGKPGASWGELEEVAV